MTTAASVAPSSEYIFLLLYYLYPLQSHALSSYPTNLIAVLGPEFVFEALRTDPSGAEAAAGRTLRFLANVDPVDVARALSGAHNDLLINLSSITVYSLTTIII